MKPCCSFIHFALPLPGVSRDVLPVCLHIPPWICSVNQKNRDRLSQLEPSESLGFVFSLCGQKFSCVCPVTLVKLPLVVQKLGSARRPTSRQMR